MFDHDIEAPEHPEIRATRVPEETCPRAADLEPAIEGARSLVAMISDTRVSRVRLDVTGLSIEIEAERPGGTSPSASEASPAETTEAAPVREAQGLPKVEVVAPLVGVFYRKPSPTDAPFVEPGDRVEAGQQIAIVEAMKMMNPVLAERPGTVAEFCAADGEVVEYQQALLVIEQS